MLPNRLDLSTQTGHSLVLSGLVLLLVASSASASEKAPETSTISPELYQEMHYRFLGPYRGGRSSAVTGVKGKPFTFYMGTAGGVFRTTNAGESWQVLSDDDFEVSSIGAIAVADSDPQVVYVGTGQATVRNNVSIGRGMYKSIDGGETWTAMGLRDAGQISRIRIDPEDPDRVYVGVVGNPFAPSDTRGLYRTLDGGESWQAILQFGYSAGPRITGIADLALDPSNPRVLYAAAWTVERKPWTIRSGGGSDGLYKSTDGGDSWIALTGGAGSSSGLPRGPIGKIGVAVGRTGERVYALIEAEPEEAGLYRSDDAGESWQKIEADVGRALITRSWYYTHLHIDPTDDNRIYVLNVGSYVSSDSGHTFERIYPPHGDSHDLWINPDHPEILAIANDGGVQISFDWGETFSTYHNQPTAEIYNITVDNLFPYGVYGSQQDNSAIRLPSRFLGALSPEAYWGQVGGCESSHIAFDPDDPVEFYAGCYSGEITRFRSDTGDYQQILLYPEMEFSRAPEELRYRFNWNAPIRMSPHDTKVVYHASNYVHRTDNGGRSWQTISPDLTTDDEETQQLSGYPITHENTGAEVYNTIFAFEESPHQPGLLFVGTDDGRVQLSRNAGGAWQDITPEQLPPRGTVNMIELSPHAPGRAFLTVKRFMLDDWQPYVFLTDDYGASWRQLTDGSNGIPATTPVRVVREDPQVEGLLYAGTEFGMFVSFDNGQRWQSLQLDLPPVPVTDLRIQDNDLVVATQGRGIYILDDLSPLHHVAEAAESYSKDTLYLYPIQDALRITQQGERDRLGENPPSGVVIDYVVPEWFEGANGEDDGSEEATPEITLEIFDSDGRVLRTFWSHKDPERNPENIYFADRGQIRLTAHAGMNRFVWNFRHPPVAIPDDLYVYGLTHGPRAVPGSYRARLTMGETVQERAFEIVPDPRFAVSEQDWQLLQNTSMQLYHDLQRVYASVESLRSVRQQLLELTTRPQVQNHQELEPMAQRLLAWLEDFELELVQPLNEVADDVENFEQGIDADLAYLLSMVDDADQGPTAGQVERTRDLKAMVDQLVGRYQTFLSEELAEFESKLLEARVPMIDVAPP